MSGKKLRLVLPVLLALSCITVANAASAQTVTGNITVGKGPQGVCFNPRTNKMYVSNTAYGDEYVSVIDASYNVEIDGIPIAGVTSGIDVNTLTNKIYVTDSADAVITIDGVTDTGSDVVSVGKNPIDLAVDTDHNKIYVANMGIYGFPSNTVSVIDGISNTVEKTITVGTTPVGVGINEATDEVYIANQDDASISIIDTATQTVKKTVGLPCKPFDVSANPATNRIYIACQDRVVVLDGQTDTISNVIEIGSQGYYLAVNPTTNTVYVSTPGGGAPYPGFVTVINGASNTVRASVPVQIAPQSLCVNPAANKVYVVNSNSGYEVPPETKGTVSVIYDPPNSSYYFAEGTCRPGFETYFCIQNPTNVEAAVNIIYMKGDGTTAPQNLVVGPHSRRTVLCRDVIGTGDDVAHDFSARVSCGAGQQIVVERPMYFNYKGAWTGGTDVMGATGTSGLSNLAEGTCRPGFDPYVCLLNPGSESAHVIMNYLKGDGTTSHQELDVAANSRATVSCRDTLGTGDDSAHDFSLNISSPRGQILAERPMYFDYRGVWTGGSDVVGTPAAADTYYFAEGTTRPGFDSYITVENPDYNAPAIKADVTITYMRGSGEVTEQAIQVAGGSRATVHPADVLGAADDAAHDFSAKVESTNGVGIVAERPMYFNYKGVWTGGHDVVGTNSASSSFCFAEGTCRPGFDTYFCIQNPGNTDAAVAITYMKGDGSTARQDVSVEGHSRFTVYCRDILGTGDDEAHDFSSKVECTNGQQIVVERPMYFNYKGVWTGGTDVVGLQ